MAIISGDTITAGVLSIRRFMCNEIGENAYLALDAAGGSAFVVDPGGEAQQIITACEAAGCALRYILLTHGHFDHIQAVRELKDATGACVMISAQDAPMLTDTSLSLGSAMGVSGFSVQCPADAAPQWDSPERLDICGVEMRVLPTPGHTPGSVCYYLPDSGVLFSGDTMFSAGYGRTDFPGGSPGAMRASLKMLCALPAETIVLPGHGYYTTIGSEAAFYL